MALSEGWLCQSAKSHADLVIDSCCGLWLRGTVEQEGPRECSGQVKRPSCGKPGAEPRVAGGTGYVEGPLLLLSSIQNKLGHDSIRAEAHGD